MKKFGLSIATIALGAVITGCGTDDGDQNTDDQTDTGDTDNDVTESEDYDDEGADTADVDETDSDTEEEQTEDGAWYEELAFYDFELEVEYGHGEYEVEYEYNDGNPEAEIEDTRDGQETEMEGQEALDHLEPIFTSLDLTEDMSDDDMRDAVLEEFDLEDDYEEFELEVEFFENGETEIEDEDE
ncbi:YusW family protein [Alteribacter natronophilus]|uniref:YusW family protein n=1 Tax=Alteribacter natronophilus TaxID=2583810 RepID=UPI00110E7D43|nr:YusW family protein [Alteribacter natronophilus]TMW70128.1 hypothetical protein FGB90_18345 [Alteribacter natronophilus]